LLIILVVFVLFTTVSSTSSSEFRYRRPIYRKTANLALFPAFHVIKTYKEVSHRNTEDTAKDRAYRGDVYKHPVYLPDVTERSFNDVTHEVPR
jgi:hypothetical protein